jgi:hypothetical protein
MGGVVAPPSARLERKRELHTALGLFSAKKAHAVLRKLRYAVE